MTKLIKAYLLFIIKSVTTVLIVLLIALIGSNLNNKLSKANTNNRLVIKNLTQSYFNTQKNITQKIYLKGEVKRLMIGSNHNQNEESNKIFVIKFDSDAQGKETELLKNEITAILSIASNKDKVVLILESPGGTVNAYGLASSELERIRARGINLTVLIDKVAASGGYMMAVIGSEIIAAPFAIIGSIGVLAEIPNFSERLQREGVKYEQIMSGEHKKSISMFSKNTEEGRQKMQEDINIIHSAFIKLVKKKRPNVDIQKVATGEFWLASQAKELGLIDKIMTSEDYLSSLYAHNKQVFLVHYEKETSVVRKILNTFSLLYDVLYQFDEMIMKRKSSFI